MTALYIRLSKEDPRRPSGGSIQNQVDLLNSYLEKHPDLCPAKTYIDEGESGVSFQRPALQALLDGIARGEITCVIVKDLSRFGRNYLESGYYLEEYFPRMGVRFISLLEHIDRQDTESPADALSLPFQNLLHDYYARDISEKARASIAIRQKRGEFIGSAPVLGYRRDPEGTHTLCVDENALPIVRAIFRLRFAGYNNLHIANLLNQAGIPAPLAYKAQRQSKFQSSFQGEHPKGWLPASVGRILKNEIYTGRLLQGKETRQSYKCHKRLHPPPEQWIEAKRKHEAIIAPWLFARMQALLQHDTRTSPKENKVHLFSGFLSCGICGRGLRRRGTRYRCPSGCLGQEIDSLCLVRCLARLSPLPLKRMLFVLLCDGITLEASQCIHLHLAFRLGV